MTYSVKQFLTTTLLVMFGLGLTGISMADSPVALDKPDSHSVEVKGKVNMYRVQIEGMNFGKSSEKAEAEVFVTIDTKPGMIYALQVHNDSPASNKVMADTLRDAYINKLPVTLYHQIAVNRSNNYKILMVQLN